MVIRVLAINLVAVALAVSAAGAESLTDRLQTGRMTVLKMDANTQQFLCVEHQRWTSVPNGARFAAGDIVKVERFNGRVERIIKLRDASDALASPEL
jgi:hypothetical protein